MRKGLFPIVTVILVLLIAIVITVLAMIFLSEFTLKPFPEEAFNKSYLRSRACLSLENIDTVEKTLTMKNCGKISLSNFRLYIDFQNPIFLGIDKLDPQELVTVNYGVNLPPETNHSFYVTADYTETPKIIFYIEEEEVQCNVYIYQSIIPYEITENNKIYCLAEDVYIGDQRAIKFSSGVQNSTLDCQEYNIDGNDIAGTSGVYLTGSSTKNNTIKNCNITDFDGGIYLYDGPNNNTLTSNIGSSNGYSISIYASSNNNINNNIANNNINGIFLSSSSYNNLINNTVSNNTINFFVGYALTLSSSSYNNLINNTVSNNTFGVSLKSSFNNNITGGSISRSKNNDYYIRESGTTNNFTNTNFTTARKIWFDETTSWFNYNNDTSSNIWLKTNVSTTFVLITRELIFWSQDLIQWNDTSDSTITARYNITGLLINTNYDVLNNSIPISGSPFNSGTNGEISFTIVLPQNEEHEITVQTS